MNTYIIQSKEGVWHVTRDAAYGEVGGWCGIRALDGETSVVNYSELVNTTPICETCMQLVNNKEGIIIPKVKVKLRNGKVMDAIAMPDGAYEVTLASGRRKTYFENQLLDIIEEVTVPSDPDLIITNEGGKMRIFHFLRETFVHDVRVVRRFVTNVLPDNIAEHFHESEKTKRPVGNILALDTGNYRFTLLEWKLVRANKPFTLMVVANKDLILYPEEDIQEFIDKAVFAHANASYSFFLKIPDSAVSWGLDDLGIDVRFAKKTAKREQELYRLASIAGVTLNLATLKLKVYSNKPIEFYDGHNFMRRSLARRLIVNCEDEKYRRRLLDEVNRGKFNHGTIRVLLEALGEIKGDVTIVPDEQIDHDLVIHVENLKKEISARGYIHITLWEHKVWHLAQYNQQNTINFPAGYPEWKQLHDIGRMLTVTKQRLADNKLPAFMTWGADAHGDDGTVNLEKLSDRMHIQQVRWNAHPLRPDITAASNLMFMAMNSMTEMMGFLDPSNRDMKDPRNVKNATSRYTNKIFRKKLFIPMTNAGLYTVMTWECATEMGGFTFPNRDKDMVFFDPRVGLVIPGKRFLETFDLHGTPDLDDSEMAEWVKLYSSSGDYAVHLGKTLPEDIELPSTKEEAMDMAFLVRSPNGPGEYSFEYIDLRGFFPEPEMVDPEAVVYIDMDDMPLPQTEMLKGVTVPGLSTSMTYHGGTLTRDDARQMISAQLSNPGIGRFCNAMMCWTNIVGDGFPAKMVDVMSNIVDASQQGIDPVQFKEIEDEEDSIYEQIKNALDADPTLMVDEGVAITRMPPRWQKEMRSRFVRGREVRVQDAYQKTYLAIINELRQKVLQMRLQSNVVAWVRGMRFSNEVKNWSEAFFNKYHYALSATDITYKTNGKMDPFTRMHFQYQHKLAMEALVEEMTNELMDMPEEERYHKVVGLYKWIVLLPRKDMPMGLKDRIIFQPNARGYISVMDILLDGLEYFGYAKLVGFLSSI